LRAGCRLAGSSASLGQFELHGDCWDTPWKPPPPLQLKPPPQQELWPAPPQELELELLPLLPRPQP
jgi:hypothetical protein